MRVFVTGGAGFIGSAVVRRLGESRHDVTAVVRDPARAILAAGTTVVAGDLSDVATIRQQISGHDAVVHLAGSYRVGISRRERPTMWEANVQATERVLDAAVTAGARRIVHVSTVNAFGNTSGRIVDETYRRDPEGGFVSWYDLTKFRAHEAAERRIAAGAPISIAMPGGTYGPGDHFAAGRMLEQAFRGRLRAIVFGDAGLTWAHVDDIAAGIVGVLESGAIGASYVLAGPPHRIRQAVAIAAQAGGRRPPRLEVPAGLLRWLVRLPGASAALREVVSASDRVTYWAAAQKAARELGFRARSLDQGARDAWG